MLQLEIPFIPINQKDVSFQKLSFILNSYNKNLLSYNLWPLSDISPVASFVIAHNRDSVFLKYFIEEPNIRACETQINGKIWEDSCVEFFISFNKDDNYYNLEFNCIGTGLIGYGSTKQDRELLSAESINKIKSYSTIMTNENKYWELLLIIPSGVFMYHKLSSLSGMECRANFYKCGDLLPKPHFLAWSNIESIEPNFHLPQYFGQIVFL